jgi:hypothetical protein
MHYEIYPLAVTQADWPTFMKVCQDVLGISPSRGLDACNWKITDPASFLAAMDMENKPLEALREAKSRGNLLEHYSVSFIAVLDDDVIVDLGTRTRLKLLTKKGRKEHVVILTGTMGEWLDAAIAGCSQNASYDFRWVMNYIVLYLEKVGFKEIFYHYDKRVQLDQTFTLSMK